MPRFNITMGSPCGDPVGPFLTVEAADLREAHSLAYQDPRTVSRGRVIISVEPERTTHDAKRGCGCRPDMLTRNVTLWQCRACGTIQHARRRRCEGAGCAESRPPAPEGRIYLTPNVKRTNFTDHAGVVRCVGCLRPE